MPQFFTNKRLILLLTSIILVVSLIGFSINNRGQLTWPEQFIKDSVGWVQSIFHQPAQYVAGFFENISEIKHTFEENKMLKAKLDEYVMLHAKVSELEKENERLRNILNKTKSESLRNYEMIQGAVIARNPEQWHDLITVNKGSQHGVEKNMAVITSKGMIGKVKYVNAFTSTIQLLSDIDRTNRISAIVKGKKDVFGLIEGYDSEKEALLFKRIPFDVKIKKDEVVISSGLGGVFPSGLVIGKVSEVVPDEFGLTQTAYIKPAANFYDIDHVIFVKRMAVSPESGNSEKTKEGEGD